MDRCLLHSCNLGTYIAALEVPLPNWPAGRSVRASHMSIYRSAEANTYLLYKSIFYNTRHTLGTVVADKLPIWEGARDI